MKKVKARQETFSFANYGAAFVASADFHKSSDAPFVRDFVAHVGCDHTESSWTTGSLPIGISAAPSCRQPTYAQLFRGQVFLAVPAFPSRSG